MKTFIIGIISFIILSINTNSYATIKWEGLGRKTLVVGKTVCVKETVTNDLPQQIKVTDIDDYDSLCNPYDVRCRTRVIVRTFVNGAFRYRDFVDKTGSDYFARFDLFNKLIRRNVVDYRKYTVCYDILTDPGNAPMIELNVVNQGPPISNARKFIS